MKIFSILVLSLLIFFSVSCTEMGVTDAKEQYSWIYLEVVTVNSESKFDYMYGEVNNRQLLKIQESDDKDLLFTIRNVRYISQQDSFEVDNDKRYEGKYSFHSSNIRMIENLKDDPLFLDLETPLSERSKRIKTRLKKQRLLLNE